MTDWNAMDDEAFRLEVRHFFQENYPEERRFVSGRLHWDEIKDWYFTLSRQGWIAPAWPAEYGGMGLSPVKLIIFIEEQERWGVARVPDHGIVMVGPLLIQHGTEEQKHHYLPKILSGEHIWCQGYSEPNAGSDLASLRTEAVLEGDHFVVNGQKTWSTLAQDANHMFMLVRTDKEARKQNGISFLLVDFTTPGITVRPIRSLGGHEEFCEVFFDDVRVPRENVVGAINKGWGVAKALLGFERLFLGSPKMAQYALSRLEAMAAQIGALDDPAFVDRLTQMRFDVADHAALYAHFADQVRRGIELGPDVSILKIFGTESYQRITSLMIEMAGNAGAIQGMTVLGDAEFDVLSPFYNARPATIYGGSSEIQRNIIARNVLGLPD